ncbi:MAG TPA: hypothetical protein VEX39_01615 [Thermoleophilaceae bacterium]|nr:hypothetical protein [Thermoleophilaceae bacterium]
MWIFAIVLLVAIGGTLAMGIWFISVPLALLLLALPVVASIARRVTGTKEVEEFRAQATHGRQEPPAEGRDPATTYDPDSQDKPPAALGS